ncbi:hypothetical protein GCM10018785_72930 [Streptomyces longispororuber]|uniref:Uncharacterized protein n=1 Tax=Streptomyces longispororuber TaxID=68230 RepID=A0A919ABR9_9ACTN|nr:hypothetical protein [Streptomyces longispororuber]GHE98062.1 hypothetical protein GCM10018785_72930 [Streptomyces longispororuber]
MEAGRNSAGTGAGVTPPLEAEITRTECKQCGSEVSGLNGRFACTLCGWCNHWSEGHSELPAAEDDPDYPG